MNTNTVLQHRYSSYKSKDRPGLGIGSMSRLTALIQPMEKSHETARQDPTRSPPHALGDIMECWLTACMIDRLGLLEGSVRGLTVVHAALSEVEELRGASLQHLLVH